MPNELTVAGLTIKTLDEINTSIATSMAEIYGSDINVAQNSPDGQLINIFGQACEDILELLVATYNSFAVETSFGIYLDQRVALNGLTRQAGTHTITNVTVVTSEALNLVGVDALVNDPTAIVYTLSDDDGNLYQLITSASIGAAGSHVLAFQAAEIGDIEPIQNTITTQITIVQGVSSVNNPSVATSFGVAEESDALLKIRHSQSFFYGSTGPTDAIEAALLDVPNVVDAFVAENDTNSPANNVPAFSIWTIVDGGTDAAVGTAIYAKKAPGCGMKGSTTYVVNRPNGTTFTAKFDRPISENLYIAFTLTPRKTGIVFDTDAIKQSLVDTLIYRLNQSATIGDVIIAMIGIEPNGVLSVVGVGASAMSLQDILAPTDYQHKFVLATARIDITIP